MLAPWIIAHFPEHKVYVEPFGGAFSVGLRKPRVYAEIYNDLADDVVNLFRVLRSHRAQELVESLRLTPFSRVEFRNAYKETDCDVERARRLVIRSFMGFGSDGHNSTRPTGFRSNSNRSGTTPAHDWVNYPDCLTDIIERLRGVTIENRDAKEVMAQHDAANCLHYVDPPYVHSTRAEGSSRGRYLHEMDDKDHRELLEFLPSLKGMVVLSGYPTDYYDEALPDWKKVERVALADGARKRTECLWINPRAWAAQQGQISLFEAAA